MKIYTRTGDDGGTALFGGGRVRKHAARVEAYGTVDELNAVLGWALTAVGDPDVRVKAKAIDSLGDVRATEATPVLIQQLFLREADLSLKQRILASLGKIGDPRAARPIMELLQHDLDAACRATLTHNDVPGDAQSIVRMSHPERLGTRWQVIQREDPVHRHRRHVNVERLGRRTGRDRDRGIHDCDGWPGNG